MTIYVDILSEDRLSRTRYAFMMLDNFNAPKLVFDGYREDTRQTTRHSFKLSGERWSRLEKRDCTISSRPNVPDSVKAEAKAKLIESITYDF